MPFSFDNSIMLAKGKLKIFRKLLKNTKQQHIYAPMNGEIVPLDDVPDPVFSERMMGEGVAIIPKDGAIYAPVHGQVIQVAPTKHAIGIATQDGTEVLIHVGLETVSLKGEGFKLLVSPGEAVFVGQPLLTYDLEYIRKHAKSTITPIVVTNSSDGNKKIKMTKEKEGIKGKTVIITVMSK